MVAGWFTGRLINRHFWRLTQSELIGGITGNIRYPLSSIDKIIVGLPNKMPIPGSNAVFSTGLLSPAIKELYAAKQAGSLLVKFQDGSLLPLKLRAMVNGGILMDELVNRLQNCVVKDYQFSDQEIKILRSADPNMIIRKK